MNADERRFLPCQVGWALAHAGLFFTTENTEATEKDDSGGFLTDSRLSATGYRLLLWRLMKSGKPASLGRYSWAKVILLAPFGPAMITIP
jgi:hypothetical protein